MAAIVSRSLRRPPHLVGLQLLHASHGRCLISEAVSFQNQSRQRSRRSLQTSAARNNAADASAEKNTAQAAIKDASATLQEEEYRGPLTQTFRRLKLFSLGSFTLTAVMSPFIFLMETASSVPLAGRIALAGTVLVTSGVSTALVAWLGKPYVTTLRRLPVGSTGTSGQVPATQKQATGVELTTMNLMLQKRITRVYDTAFLVPTNRPLAKWELAEAFKMPAKEVEEENRQDTLPRREVIAETLDKDGNYLGWWLVEWDKEGNGTCFGAGRIEHYFNVHEELLSRPIK